MSDEAIKDDPQTVEESWATNEAAAAAALELSDAEWQGLKAMDGFPPRDKSKGWPLHAIRAWMAVPPEGDDAAPPDPPASSADPPADKLLPEPEDEVGVVELILPVADPREGTYIASQMGRVDVRLDRLTELPGFKRLHAGLRAENAEFPNGKPVDTPQDVVRYVMWQVTLQLANA